MWREGWCSRVGYVAWHGTRQILEETRLEGGIERKAADRAAKRMESYEIGEKKRSHTKLEKKWKREEERISKERSTLRK